jgi:hypothetical protein
MSQQRELIDVWVITPHVKSEYDYCIIPVSQDPIGDAAVEHAKDALEMRLEDIDLTVDSVDIHIKIQRKKMYADELPEGVEP